MKLERLVVGGFGTLKPGLTLEFGPGLNLVIAPNEWGKSTLAEFITGLFYGFGSRKAGVHSMEPWEGGETGGELLYRLADGRGIVLRRHLTKRAEQMEIQEESGRPLDLGGRDPGESHLGCTRGVFWTVARLGLDELSQAFSGAPGKERTATEQALKGYFFQEAATRGEVANPVGVGQLWREEREKLYSRDGRKGKSDQALRKLLAQVGKQLDQAQRREQDALAAREELAGLEQKLAALRGEHEQAQGQVQAAQAALALARDRARLAELQTQIREITAKGVISPEQAGQIKSLWQEAEARRARSQEREAQAKQAAAQATELSQGRPAQEMETALDALAGDLAAHRARGRELETRGQAMAGREQELGRRWGAAPEDLAALEDALPFRLAGLRDDLAQARSQEEESAQELALAQSAGRTPWLPLALVGLAAALALIAWMAGWPWWWPTSDGAVMAAGVFWFFSIKQGRAKNLKQAAGQARAAHEKAESLAQELAQAQDELPDGLAQAQPAEMAAAREAAAALLHDLDELAAAQAAWREQEAALQSRLAELGPADSGEAMAILDQARQRCRRAAQAARTAQEREREAAESAAQAEETGEQADKALAELGLTDAKGLEQALERGRQIADLQAKAAEVADRLPAATDAPALDIEQAQAQASQAQGRLSELERLGRESAGRAGELRQALRDLAAAGGVAAAQGELDRLERQRQDLAREHDALLLGEALLERAMEHFRLEAQPNLLVRAADYLEQATDGAYSWLGADIFQTDASKPPELSARPGPGARDRQAGALSRGTRDQLYLALRLALADEVTGAGEIIPLILDDPLVNFDDNRLNSSLRMVGAVAGRRQVLFLTCHRKQADILSSLTQCKTLSLE